MSDKPTDEQLNSAMKIPLTLEKRLYGITGPELIRRVYNEAIDDASNFLRDIAQKNPAYRLAIEAAGREVRTWLIIPEKVR